MRLWVVAAFTLVACDAGESSSDAGSCMTRWAAWSDSINAIAPARECTVDEDCVLVSASLECTRDGGPFTPFFQGCTLPAHRDSAATFEVERARLTEEVCDSPPSCWVEGCNVDGGMPGVRCVAGLCNAR